jgi:hypothetical protein
VALNGLIEQLDPAAIGRAMWRNGDGIEILSAAATRGTVYAKRLARF